MSDLTLERVNEHVIQRAVIPLADGERIAGAILKDDGTVDYYLIKLPSTRAFLKYHDAVAHAVERGGRLPNQREACLLGGNLRDEIRIGAHWLLDDDPFDSDRALCFAFHFCGGLFDSCLKCHQLNVVVVRRFKF
ncbi:hypothetical protein [Burkholderia diffusa]|uniref:hypothetical protein n=1 Tax=Burkholderia diffusa TaxID=488732 RepID=UPI00158AF88A|nr:hypothetical protein [Burkholderia diffusa]